MKVLVVAASKHGSTDGIARAIADELRTQSILVDVKSVGDPVQLDEYKGVVLGSAVYMGRWLPEALNFVETHQNSLASRPLWLFSSGPLGDPPKGSVESNELQRMIAETSALDHRLFAGSLDPEHLGFKDKLMVKVVHSPTGDFRNWEEIRAWADEIGASLLSRVTPES